MVTMLTILNACSDDEDSILTRADGVVASAAFDMEPPTDV